MNDIEEKREFEENEEMKKTAYNYDDIDENGE